MFYNANGLIPSLSVACLNVLFFQSFIGFTVCLILIISVMNMEDDICS